MDPQEPQERPQQENTSNECNSDEEQINTSVGQQPSVSTILNTDQGDERTQEPSTSHCSQRPDRSLQLVPLHRHSLRRMKQQHTIRLMGTHTSESSTDQTTVEAKKCLPYDNMVAVRNVREAPIKCTVLENVRGYIQEMDADKHEYYMEGIVGRTSSEVGQRRVMEIARVVQHEEAHRQEKLQDQTTEQEDSNEQHSELAKQSEKVEMLEQSSASLKADQEHAVLVERFKVIMDLFDDFTRNLESVDLKGSTVQTKSDVSPQRLRDPSPKVVHCGKRQSSSEEDRQEQSTRGRCSRFEDFYGKDFPRLHKPKEQHLRDPLAQDKLIPVPETEPPHSQTEETFPYSLDKDERIDMATTMSGIALTPSAQVVREPQPLEVLPAPLVPQQNTVSCQTSKFELLSLGTDETKTKESAASPHTIVTMEHENDDERQEDFISEYIPQTRDKSAERQALVEYQPVITTPEPQTMPDNFSVGPMERTFHTIHIDASSSPSSSVMRRPPLCTRFWNVVTDFCAAVCLCLQVNKDCLFCTGFLFAFIISASFLSAFFYRTLSLPLPVYQHQHSIAVQQPAPIQLEFLETNENIRDAGGLFL